MVAIEIEESEIRRLESELAKLKAQMVHLILIEEAARAAVRYHVQGYGLTDEFWDPNHMLHLLDQLAKVLEE